VVSVIKSRHPDAAVLISAQLGDERLLSSTKTVMWSTKEIEQYVSAVLTSAGVDGVVFKGLGNYVYDLGNPEFTAQRQALKASAPVSSSSVESASTRTRAPASF
jgi:hypothetical protein